MSKPVPHVAPERIVAQLGWIRGLARELVGDVHLADDLAQDACLTALERGPRDPGKLRGWLRAVLVNRVRQVVRGDGRRAGREADTARREELESTANVVERAAVHRGLADAVLALDEPYRTAILSRYFDGLPPREIARRTGTPVATVQSHLKRGIARLRATLDEANGGDRQAWLALIVPVATGPVPTFPIDAVPTVSEELGRASLTPGSSLPTGSLGALLVNTKLVLSSLVGAVALGAIAYVAFDDPARAVANGSLDSPRSRAGLSVPEEAAAAAFATGASGDGERAEVAGAPPASGGAPSAALADEDDGTWVLRGRVIDTDAAPLAGVELVVEGFDDVRFATMSGGGFEVTTNKTSGRVVPAPQRGDDRARWVAVHEAAFRRGSVLEPVVVVADALRLAGEIVDEFGAPVAGARLRLDLPDDLDVVLGRVLEATRQPSFTGTADAHGAFELRDIPRVSGATWHVTAEGYERTIVEAPERDDLTMRVVLAQPQLPLDGTLSGRVVDPEGAPVAGARVAVGLTNASTNNRGEFRVDLSRALTADRIVAVKAGYLPAIEERAYVPRAGDERGAQAGWPDFVELELGGPPLTIKGRVVATDGTPVAGARVWTPDGVHFGTLGRMPTTLENLAAGAPVPSEAFSSEMPETDSPNAVHGAHTRIREPSALWNWTETDAAGRFELTGLADRDYRLTALDVASLQQETSAPVAAGSTGVTLTIPFEKTHELVRGRVVTDRGRPVPEVFVRLEREPFFVRARFFGGVSEVGIIESRESVRTDDDGGFEFERVPTEGIRLVLRADTIVPTEFELPGRIERDASGKPGSIDVVVDARCHVRMELDAFADEADQVGAIDEAGNRLPLMKISDGSFNSRTYYPLVEGRTGVLSVSSRARTVQVMRGEEVLAELPLDLLPGAVTVVRP